MLKTYKVVEVYEPKTIQGKRGPFLKQGVMIDGIGSCSFYPDSASATLGMAHKGQMVQFEESINSYQGKSYINLRFPKSEPTPATPQPPATSSEHPPKYDTPPSKQDAPHKEERIMRGNAVNATACILGDGTFGFAERIKLYRLMRQETQVWIESGENIEVLGVVNDILNIEPETPTDEVPF